MQSYPSLVFYIHKPTLAKHVRHAKPLHQWCKKEVVFSNGTIYIAPEQQQGNPSSLSQFSIDAGIATSSYTYFEKLFHTVLYPVEEEIEKILVKGKNGFILCMFLLKCQSLKEFGGGQ